MSAAECRDAMRAVVQRVTAARVTAGDRLLGAIDRGLLVLLGIGHRDSRAEADWLVDKVLDLRLFENEAGKFDRSLREVGGAVLVVSQFTLLGDARKGRRPSFSDAAQPERAIPLYEHFVARARASGLPVATGEFGARMQVQLVNDGPVTLVIDAPAA